MAWQIASPVVLVAAALLFMALEKRFPYDPGQRVFRQGFWSDLLLYALLQSYVLGWVIGGLIHWMDSRTGMSRLHLLTGWPLWAQLLFFFVVHDFYIYWFHRAQHRFKVLWRIHEAHHSTPDVDWLSGSRSHSLEILINQTIEFAPIALLGAPAEVAFLKAWIDAVWGMYIHSNINVHSGRLQWVINGPEMHRWHHALDIEHQDINFGTKLAIWDWLFGTGRLISKRPSGYGISDPTYPQNYFLQHLFAFRRFPKEPLPVDEVHSLPPEHEGQANAV